MMDKTLTLQKIGLICSIVQIMLSTVLLIYNWIYHESLIIWIVFLCSGICLLISNIGRNIKKEDN
jgi:hypothetical protein